MGYCISSGPTLGNGGWVFRSYPYFVGGDHFGRYREGGVGGIQVQEVDGSLP